MIYKIMNIEDLNDELIQKYFPMLTEGRQKKISLLRSAHERSVVFCSEILARQCLSELCDAPEFSFQLLCNPNSKSVVGNFDAEISIVSYDNFVACAVSRELIGISLFPIKSFSFSKAQEKFTDIELRAIFSDSVYTFSEIIKADECNELKVIRRYALLSSLKDAHFMSTGRGIRSDIKETLFEFNGTGMTCSDRLCRICESYIDNEKQLAVSVIERSKNE